MRRKLILVWRQFATAERRTAFSLLLRGFLCRKEPSLVLAGRKPDYLTFGRGRMWVEVKGFDPPPSQALLDAALNDLRPRVAGISIPCRIDAWVSGVYNQRAAILAIRILERQLVHAADGDVFFVGIPVNPAKQSLVMLEYATTRGTARIYSPRSLSAMYGYPRSAPPADWTGQVAVQDGKSVVQHHAYEILHGTEPFVITLRVHRASPLPGFGGVGSAEAGTDKTIDKLRARIEDAASQLRNGRKYLDVPGVVSVYNDHLGADQFDLLRACLGDITIPFDRSTLKADPAYLGQNGVMRRNKNTTVSAVTYSSRLFSTISLMNPFATLPVPAGWLPGMVYCMENNSDVVVAGAAR